MPAPRDAAPHPDARLLRSWSDGVDAVLADLLAPGQQVALINFPNHANAGDPALWLGELAALRRIGVEVVYQASWSSYDATTLRRALGEGTVLLHGGANFGDLYPANQASTRERALVELVDLRMIQLPQSIHFADPMNRGRLARLCERHDDFTLLTREPQSLEYARDHFDVPSELCPDPAFALGPIARARPAYTDVLWLRRSDPEAAGYRFPNAPNVRVEALDWLAEVPDEPRWATADRLRHRMNRRLLDLDRSHPGAARRLWRVNAATFEPLAQAWVARGCSILARGRVVITDRLHGHILSLLQGIPHVAMDNSYGKVRAVHDEWTHASSLVRWADSPAEAIDSARELLAASPPAPS